MERRSGFVLIEVILASAIFLLLVVALGGALLYGQEATVLAGNRARAVLLADEGLEAVRNIRDEDYTLLTNGTYGLAEEGSAWTFAGAEDTNDIYVRRIIIADAGVDEKEITVQVDWQQNGQRSGNVTLISRLSNWRALPIPPPLP